MHGAESLVIAYRRRPLPLWLLAFASGQQDLHRRRFPSPDCLSQEAMFLVERRISLFWIVPGQTRMSTSLPSLPGLVSVSPPSSIIGSDEWLLNIIVLRNSFLAGHSTDRAAAGALRPQMNFLTLLLLGLKIQIHGSERRGRRAKDWRSSWRIAEPCLFWMAWSPSKIHLVHKKDGYVILRYRRFCGNSLPSTQDFV